MYIAVTRQNHTTSFVLRKSYQSGEKYLSRDLYPLGPDPSVFIKYPGGNAFYLDEDLENAVRTSLKYPDELEDLFWPWVRPDIRRAVETFRNRSYRPYKKLSGKEKNRIEKNIHPFDKRRCHYLKFANMDQGAVVNMPPAVFKDLLDCSRDEIEQYFLKAESILKAHELKSYVFTVFDLQSFFMGFMAKSMPHVLDQDKVDTYFGKELCQLNHDLFGEKSNLNDYMIRYAVMFFDHAYADTRLLDEMSRDFMFRHRTHRPPPVKNVPVRTALKVFKITKTELRSMNKRQLTRIFRKRAREVHPDTGGSHDAFVELNNAYKSLLEKVK